MANSQLDDNLFNGSTSHGEEGRCKLRWLTFCVFMDFLQNVLYSNAINAS
jgi:hypothetical protein